ncbi:MAG: phosphoribosyl-ATP diphosphatase [Rhizobiaceae bacterium]|nr:phosphoribosyl-ATP diphosphatase [Rhizobiaceae bacterium]
MTSFTLTDLEAIVARRAASGDASSYTAKLAAKGISGTAKKLGEEAVETVIAAVSQDEAALACESADLLYHLMVVLHLRGVPFSDVLAELERRTAETGLEEKARRPAEADPQRPASRGSHRHTGD